MDSSGASQVVAALELIYDPKSDNLKRLEAQKFLDDVKNREESPFWGYEIALNNPQNSILKHFGLGLLVNALRKNWSTYNEEKRITLRKWIIELNYRVQDDDPRYIREKLAFLWVEIAKRTWGEALKVDEPSDQQLTESWVDMDSNLTELWQMNEASFKGIGVNYISDTLRRHILIRRCHYLKKVTNHPTIVYYDRLPHGHIQCEIQIFWKVGNVQKQLRGLVCFVHTGIEPCFGYE